MAFEDSSNFEINNKQPTAQEFISLRSTVGWKSPETQEVEKSINNSLFWITVYHNEELIGAGRVVGDGAMYFYVQDVIVHPEYQGSGLGYKVMERIEHYLAKTCKKGSTIGLFAAQGKEGFYKKFGYSLRDGQELGYGMCKFV